MEKKETVKNIIIALFFLTLSVGGGMMMYFNFPHEKTENVSGKNGITADGLSNIPGRIAEEPFDNFTIDADVKVGLKDNFNIYTAASYKFDSDKWAEILLKDTKIINDETDEEFKTRYIEAEDGSNLNINNGICPGVGFAKKEMADLFYYTVGKLNAKYTLNENFPKKDLDFMSCDEAVDVVKNVMDNFDIPISKYSVYPVDYEYIKKTDDELTARFAQSESDSPYSNQVVTHTKDAEHYLINMEAKLPNNGVMLNFEYSPSFAVYSGKLNAYVGKSGLIDLNVDGIYNITDEKENKYIVSFKEAINSIKNIYKDVKFNGKINVYKIELGYIPYVMADDLLNPVYELKPTWIFRMNEDLGEEFGLRYFEKIIDATTGKEFMTAQ